MIDWSECPDVERVPGKVGGVWVIKGTRIPAEAVVENAADGFSAEQLAGEIFEGLPVAPARRVIAFAMAHANPA